MQSARHDKRYATSGIAAHPFDYAQWQALAKNARMGQPPFVMGKEEQSMKKAGPAPKRPLLSERRLLLRSRQPRAVLCARGPHLRPVEASAMGNRGGLKKAGSNKP